MAPEPDRLLPADLRSVGLAVVLAATYFAAAKVGLALAAIHPSASAVWPPTGIAIAALLLGGRGLWPGIFAGAFAANATNVGNVLSSLGIATGNTLEALVAAWLVQRFAGGVQVFQQAGNVLRFAGLAALGATTVSATIGVGSLVATGFASSEGAAAVWLTWWLGDAVGAFLVTPLLVLWLAPPRPRWETRPIGEGAVLLAAVVVAGWLAFGPLFPAGQPLAFLTLPPLLAMAYRFGPRGAALSGAVLAVVATAGTLQGRGPFGPAGLAPGLVLLQAFLASVVVTMLTLAALVAERRRVLDNLERRVEERTASLTRSVDALRRSQALLAEAERIADVGSWEWDVATDRVAWSDQLFRIYGLEREGFQATYKAFLERVHPEDRPAVEAAIGEAYATGQPFLFEHRIVRSDGAERVLQARGQVDRDASGQVLRMAGTAHDITARKQTEAALAQLQELERLREVDRFKTHFLNIAAHELSTPLTPLRLQLAVLKTAAPGSVQQRKSMEILERNVDRLAALVQDILEAARLQAGRLQVRKGPQDLDTLVREAVETYQDPAEGRGIALVLKANGGLPVEADRDRIHQVLLNLLGNAWKFTPPGGRITVETVREDGMALVLVHDTGIGLVAEDIPRLFQPFSQVHDHEQRHQGTGLGLFISKGIIDLHGGRIWCRSEGPGKGATFAFALPLRQG
jgi:PAS domain S-box-containing protein